MPWWKFWAEDDPDGNRPDYYDEGVALVRQERFHDALTSFRLALRDKPDDPATLEQIAVVYTHIGLIDEAIRSYREALEIRPGSPSAHYGIAFLLLREGATDAAVDHLKKFLSSDRANWDEDRHVQYAQTTLANLIGERPESRDRTAAERPPAEAPSEDPVEAADEPVKPADEAASGEETGEPAGG
jgi:Flp pilus assembly protein TadD